MDKNSYIKKIAFFGEERAKQVQEEKSKERKENPWRKFQFKWGLSVDKSLASVNLDTLKPVDGSYIPNAVKFVNILVGNTLVHINYWKATPDSNVLMIKSGNLEDVIEGIIYILNQLGEVSDVKYSFEQTDQQAERGEYHGLFYVTVKIPEKYL